MQLAILLVLLFIAVVIAPWLVGVAIAAAAIYGIYIVTAAALAVVGFIVAFVWVILSNKNKKDKPEEIHGERRACKFCQVEMASSATRCKNCGQVCN